MSKRIAWAMVAGALAVTCAAPHALEIADPKAQSGASIVGQSLDYVRQWLRLQGEDAPTTPEIDPFLDEQARLARHAEVIVRMRGAVQHALELREEQDSAPAVTINPFTKTRSDYDEDVSSVLNELETMLLDGGVSRSVEQIEVLGRRIDGIGDEIGGLREQRFTAPEESRWSESKSDIDDRIARLGEEIEALENEILLIKGRIAVRFDAIGVELDEEQIDRLLTRIDGDDILGMTAMISIVAEMTGVLKTLMEENASSLDYARRYYGTALVLRELVVHAQGAYIARVDDVWLERLAIIDDQLRQAITADREQLQSEKNADRKRIFSGNLAQNRRALEVLGIYRDRLIDQQDRVRRAREDALRDVAAAYSTYRTVSLSSLLVDLVEQEAEAFDALLLLQLPEIVPFENPELEERFRSLTLELKASS